MSRSLKETYEKGVAMQNQIALDLRQAQQRSWEATAALRASEKKIAAEKSKAEQRVALSDELKLHSQLKTYLTSARVRLSSSIWENLLGYASDKISEATEDDLTDLRRDLQGNLRGMQGGHDVLVEDLGGAKQSIVGLALRVALSQVFYGQGLPLLLDEVTSDCSDSTAAAMAGMLMGLGVQSICVSHRQGDASNADNIVEIL
jgi:ABC-type transport system involved in cytochrome bd biosynthesis fused ATPase/permease subunit